MIRVEIKNEILGNKVIWEGSEKDIEEIKNIPARLIARQVVKDGKERKSGMWLVRKTNE